jgi:hypothetical protein
MQGARDDPFSTVAFPAATLERLRRGNFADDGSVTRRADGHVRIPRRQCRIVGAFLKLAVRSRVASAARRRQVSPIDRACGIVASTEIEMSSKAVERSRVPAVAMLAADIVLGVHRRTPVAYVAVQERINVRSRCVGIVTIRTPAGLRSGGRGGNHAEHEYDEEPSAPACEQKASQNERAGGNLQWIRAPQLRICTPGAMPLLGLASAVVAVSAAPLGLRLRIFPTRSENHAMVSARHGSERLVDVLNVKPADAGDARRSRRTVAHAGIRGNAGTLSSIWLLVGARTRLRPDALLSVNWFSRDR